MADHFPEVTILFADIAGFTKWSSTREPEHVFLLLERIYKSLDELAPRRRVLKIETIGDCYMAVTGLPKPNPNHAAAMARFASDALLRMSEVTRDLSTALGSDTEDLSLRIGMHSGSVTGGVLRTQNARFQLFGDCVNTASRMETTGQPGRIHISEETANELISKGHRDWLSTRQDVVTAKGKGELLTYWLNPTPAESARTFSSTGASQRQGFL